MLAKLLFLFAEPLLPERPGGRAESLEHVYRMLYRGDESFLQGSHQYAVCNPLRSLRLKLGAARRLL